MEIIGNQKVASYFDDVQTPRAASNTAIRQGKGHPVGTFFALAKKVAELQFLNREHVLLFRGQAAEVTTDNGLTVLKPRLFRGCGNEQPKVKTVEGRFDVLKNAEQLLVDRYQSAGYASADRLERQRVLRWTILQHYEVCRTPLLDVTQSLRVAATFASLRNETKEAYLYVLGVPNISGAVTASSEAGLQVVRLASACPPEAVRPHLQEGYLLGEYPEMSDFGQHIHYHHREMDFARRLVAKFRFNPARFWTSNFSAAPEEALLPPERRDPLLVLAAQIKRDLNDPEG